MNHFFNPPPLLPRIPPRLSANFHTEQETNSPLDGPWFDKLSNRTSTLCRFAWELFDAVDSRYRTRYIDDGKFLRFRLTVFGASAASNLLFNDHDFTEKYYQMAKIPYSKTTFCTAYCAECRANIFGPRHICDQSRYCLCERCYASGRNPDDKPLRLDTPTPVLPTQLSLKDS